MTEAPTKTRRRWLRFSLRTLLMLVTALAIWLGWNANVVHHRRKLIDWSLEHDGNVVTRQESLTMLATLRSAGSSMAELEQFDGLPDVSWIRQLLGDESIALFEFGDSPPTDEKAELRKWFPESLFDYDAPRVSSERGTYEEDAVAFPGRISFPTIGPGRRAAP